MSPLHPFSRGLILDVLLNVCLYVPVGAATLVAIAPWPLAPAWTVLLGFAISLGVELTQRYVPTRTGTFNDLLANTGGAALGAAAVWLWRGRLGLPLRRFLERALSPEGVVLSGLWLLWHGFLLLPVIKHGGFPPFEPAASVFWSDTVDVFLGFCGLSLALRDHPRTAIALALVPAALFLYPAAAGARVAAAGLAILASRAAASAAFRRFLQPAVLAWLAFSELRPFQWGAPKSFLWLPFEPLFSNPADRYYPLVFGKFFLYAAIVWILRWSGARWIAAAGLPVLILAAGEFAERYLPARTPELTDIVLAAAGAVLLALVDRPRPAAPACDP